MRIMFISVIAVVGITAYGFSSHKTSDEIINNTEQIIDNLNDEQHDPIVTGVSISKEHLAKWHERKRKSVACNGCLDFSQPYPEDEI